MKVALITGITGQDGSYLAELLLEKGSIGRPKPGSQCFLFYSGLLKTTTSLL